MGLGFGDNLDRDGAVEGVIEGYCLRFLLLWRDTMTCFQGRKLFSSKCCTTGEDLYIMEGELSDSRVVWTF